MAKIIQFITEFFSLFNNVTFTNILDIIALTFIFYKLAGVIKDTKAEQLVKGYLVLLVVQLLSKGLGFIGLTWLIENALSFGVIAFVIIFQPEFRRILGHLGETTFANLKKNNNSIVNDDITECLTKAVFDLSKEKTGALIVIARRNNLQDYFSKGTPIDGIITHSLILNSFIDGTPLHDGALIIQDGRIKAGNCVLPLTEQSISHKYGTRHRAALGISEECDAISIVVSEETGDISICENGKLTHYYNKVTFKQELTALLQYDNFINDIRKKRFKVWSKLKKSQ